MSTFLQLYNRVLDYTHRPKYMDKLEAGALVNDAYIFVVSQLRCNPVSTGAIPLSATITGDYSIVDDLGVSDFSTLRVARYTAANGSSTLNTLAPSTPDEVTALRSANPSATTPATTYAISGWDTLMLQPMPALGDSISLIYDAVPLLMVLDTDTPTRLPQEWHHLIVQRAAATAFEVVDDQRALQHQAAFEAELKRARLWFNQRQSSRGFSMNVNTNRGLVLWPGDYFSSV